MALPFSNPVSLGKVYPLSTTPKYIHFPLQETATVELIFCGPPTSIT